MSSPRRMRAAAPAPARLPCPGSSAARRDGASGRTAGGSEGAGVVAQAGSGTGTALSGRLSSRAPATPLV